MCDNYTNKDEKPMPKYKKGDETWCPKEFLGNDYYIVSFK